MPEVARQRRLTKLLSALSATHTVNLRHSRKNLTAATWPRDTDTCWPMAESTVYIGLCTTCRHSEHIVTRPGSVFRFCSLSRLDPYFPKYPRLPVIRCTGHEDTPALSCDELEEPTRVRFTREMIRAIQLLEWIPKRLRMDAAIGAHDVIEVVVELGRGEAEQLAELCQLYISSDSEPSGLPDRSRILGAIVAALSDARI
jgi:hypothetical protein